MSQSCQCGEHPGECLLHKEHCATCNDTGMVGICGAAVYGDDFCVLRPSTTHVHYGSKDVAGDWEPASPCPECLACKACGSNFRRGMFCEWCGSASGYERIAL